MSSLYLQLGFSGKSNSLTHISVIATNSWLYRGVDANICWRWYGRE